MKQNLINHVVLILDGSGSMGHLKESVIKVADNQIANLAELSKQMDQETRVSVYVFDNRVDCVIFDKDVLRLPSIKDLYRIGGQTALMDAIHLGVTDLKQTFAKYFDHSFLTYIITDGYENCSIKCRANDLSNLISGLNDDWTVAAFVPDVNSKMYLEKYGVPKNNIVIWETTAQGMQEVARKIQVSTQSYMQNRSRGVRSTSNLFNLDTSNLNTKVVKKELDELASSKFRLLDVKSDGPIKEFVSDKMGSYVLGNSFYQLMKPEKVQPSKQICVRSKRTGKVFSGQNARDLLGLPNYEVKVAPAHADFDIFVQSSSVNRKLIAGTKLLVMK